MLRRFALSRDFVVEQETLDGENIARLLASLPEASVGVLRRIRDTDPSVYQKTIAKLCTEKASHRQLLAEYENLLQQNDLIPDRVDAKRAPNRFSSACEVIAKSNDKRLGLSAEDKILTLNVKKVPICADIVIWQPSRKRIIAIECKYVSRKERAPTRINDLLAHASLGSSISDLYWLFFPKNSGIITPLSSVLSDIGLANVGLAEVDVGSKRPSLSIERVPEAKQPLNARDWFAEIISKETR